MRRTLTLLVAMGAATFAIAGSASAGVTPTDTASGTLSMKVKVTGFHATERGIVATGTLSGQLASGGETARDSSPVKFRVLRRGSQRCDVITLRLAPLFLELLGARVETSHISLDVYAKKGRVLGDLFCALARAQVSFPDAARKLNKHLAGRPLRVAAAETPVVTRDHMGTCQVLKLILGPLHLDLLGLVVDLYGQTTADPVVVTIVAVPGHGLLGDLLCSLAGGNGITNLGQLQGLLQNLGVIIGDLDLENLLSSLGINLADGLSTDDLQGILGALGLGGDGISSLSQLQTLLQGLGVTITDLDLQNQLNSLGINLTDGMTPTELQQILTALGVSGTP